jgi:raffinose/stachyose/melibiose transport system permease protein
VGLFRYTTKTFAREIVLLLGALVFFIPVYLLITMSVKTTHDVFTEPLTPPTHPVLSNVAKAWHGTGGVSIARALVNSLVITTGTVVALIAIGSLCAYTLARRPSKMSSATYYAFLIAIIIPFQLGIVPIFVAMRRVSLIPSFYGAILLNTGLLMPLSVFLYTGFIRTMPKEYEEAAEVDGASLTRTFLKVVFPLLRPVTTTVAILTGVITWNEFFLALIFLGGSKYQPLPVSIYQFVGEYVTQWNFVFAAVLIAIAPMVLFYFFAQKQLIRGFSGGIRG